LGNCNWDYGLGGKGYEKIEIKKLETRGDCNWDYGIWNMGYDARYRIQDA